MIERREITDRNEWLEWRKLDVTASTIGALFGCDPYRTALRLYAEKRGTEFQPLDADSKVLQRGRDLEPALAIKAGKMRPDWRVIAGTEYVRDPQLRLGATPDYLIEKAGKRGILQCKTTAASVWHRDWNDGTDPPLWVLLQTSTEMLLENADFGAVAVMLVDSYDYDFRLIELPRNPAVEAKIIVGVRKFWEAVEEGIEPEPDFGRDRDVIRALHAQVANGFVLDWRQANDVPVMLADRASKKAEIKEREAAIEKIETELIHRLGDAEAALVDGFKVSYKKIDVAGYTVPPRSSRQLRILDRRKP